MPVPLSLVEQELIEEAEIYAELDAEFADNPPIIQEQQVDEEELEALNQAAVDFAAFIAEQLEEVNKQEEEALAKQAAEQDEDQPER